MISLEDVKLYLPKYLSPENQKNLFDCLRSFPASIDRRMYTFALQNEPAILQGDGLRDLLIIHLPETTTKPSPGIILSNTCDVDLANSRRSSMSVCYAPLILMSRYRAGLLTKKLESDESIEGHLQEIRRQRVTNMFFLPACGQLEEDSIALLDKIISCSNSSIDRADLSKKRLFTLSDYGVWLLALKLSIHFCRLMDGVKRPI